LVVEEGLDQHLDRVDHVLGLADAHHDQLEEDLDQLLVLALGDVVQAGHALVDAVLVTQDGVLLVQAPREGGGQPVALLDGLVQLLDLGPDHFVEPDPDLGVAECGHGPLVLGAHAAGHEEADLLLADDVVVLHQLESHEETEEQLVLLEETDADLVLEARVELGVDIFDIFDLLFDGVHVEVALPLERPELGHVDDVHVAHDELEVGDLAGHLREGLHVFPVGGVDVLELLFLGHAFFVEVLRLGKPVDQLFVV